MFGVRYSNPILCGSPVSAVVVKSPNHFPIKKNPADMFDSRFSFLFEQLHIKSTI
ncbi:hypothetical protein Syun_027303 [Stephania yunnanensis]|uniref:Uncharacterized protein n=1 Tax=Stephania yunnanensis TaxID=152371 RepID=A0AAP0EIQ6_9MAGN